MLCAGMAQSVKRPPAVSTRENCTSFAFTLATTTPAVAMSASTQAVDRRGKPCAGGHAEARHTTDRLRTASYSELLWAVKPAVGTMAEPGRAKREKWP